jgi:hypothetical protein
MRFRSTLLFVALCAAHGGCDALTIQKVPGCNYQIKGTVLESGSAQLVPDAEVRLRLGGQPLGIPTGSEGFTVRSSIAGEFSVAYRSEASSSETACCKVEVPQVALLVTAAGFRFKHVEHAAGQYHWAEVGRQNCVAALSPVMLEKK